VFTFQSRTKYAACDVKAYTEAQELRCKPSFPLVAWIAIAWGLSKDV